MAARNILILLAAGGSGALMLGALGFQHLGDLPPCKMCIWQRYPHVLAILIGLIALRTQGPFLPLLGMLAALTTAIIGLYHSGVEQGFWQGPTSCTSSGGGGLSETDFFDQIINAPLIRCDEIPWQMLGLSMAGWNAVISLLLAILWLRAARRT